MSARGVAPGLGCRLLSGEGRQALWDCPDSGAVVTNTTAPGAIFRNRRRPTQICVAKASSSASAGIPLSNRSSNSPS